MDVRKDGTISGVSDWPKRPTSNLSGVQGQHLTAYVTFEHAILSHVKDVNVPQAAAALSELLSEILILPGMSILSRAYLNGPIKDNMKMLRMNADNPVVVGEVIDNILTIRNKIPGTTARDKGGGHGEATSSGTLETLETALRRESWHNTWEEAIVVNQCCSLMWQLLDYNPTQPAYDNAVKVIGDKVLTHFLSLRMAYPKTFEWLTVREAYLFTYLEANRDGRKMPLKKLT